MTYNQYDVKIKTLYLINILATNIMNQKKIETKSHLGEGIVKVLDEDGRSIHLLKGATHSIISPPKEKAEKPNKLDKNKVNKIIKKQLAGLKKHPKEVRNNTSNTTPTLTDIEDNQLKIKDLINNDSQTTYFDLNSILREKSPYNSKEIEEIFNSINKPVINRALETIYSKIKAYLNKATQNPIKTTAKNQPMHMKYQSSIHQRIINK